MKILFCSSEVYPYSKTGGLADIAHALPLALGRRSHEVMIVTPRYAGISKESDSLSDRVKVVFVKHDGYFNRPGIYGTPEGDFSDNAERFSFFSREILAVARKLNFKPDVIHLQEWHTALAPLYLREELRRNRFFEGSRTLLTIHNLAYMGAFPAQEFGKLRLGPEVLSSGDMAYYGRISFLKAGILRADGVSTVSKTYAREIRTKAHGCGLDNAIKSRRDRVVGILNGLDNDVWDPARDPAIAANFGPESLEVKAENKSRLQKQCGLRVKKDVPLFGIVSRLVEQKGFDLMAEAFEAMMKLGIQFMLLGTGEAKYHRFFERVAKKYKGQVAATLAFKGALAPQIYAGSDFFLMPSRFEPCGLGQLISFRYGTVPVVHHTGGLADTVKDHRSGPASGTGIVFTRYEAGDLLRAVKRAVALYRSKKAFRNVQRRIMRLDHSWKRSAAEYAKLYEKIRRA